MNLLREAVIILLLGLSVTSVPFAIMALFAGVSGRLADTDYFDNVFKGAVCCGLGLARLGIAFGLVRITNGSRAILRWDKPGTESLAVGKSFPVTAWCGSFAFNITNLIRATISTTACHYCFVTALVFSLIGCGITFDEPLTPIGSSVDPRLLGEWLIAGDDEPSVLISENRAIFAYPDLESETVSYAATRIEGHDFISYSMPTSDGAHCRWLLLKYKCVSNDEIQIFAMEDEKVAEAIRTGGLSGESTRVKPSLLFALLGEKTHEKITKMRTSRADLHAFLKANPEKCFDVSEPLVTLKRKQPPKACSDFGGDGELDSSTRRRS